MEATENDRVKQIIEVNQRRLELEQSVLDLLEKVHEMRFEVWVQVDESNAKLNRESMMEQIGFAQDCLRDVDYMINRLNESVEQTIQ